MPKEDLRDVMPDVRLATDIGLHACQEACRVIKEIVERCPRNSEKTVATLIAFNGMKLKLLEIEKVHPALALMNEIIDPERWFAKQEAKRAEREKKE